ncbi:hypothetical protein ACPSLY_16305 [Vibrio parahaemolyticus]|uniref:hypothetical protein n=1 Tax=Vibrio TaxID=662 RepID=UPI000471B431|nr:hypothetical protein [Vibrio parahaemolyticus]EJL3960751.1 hypothetical protein [Vibrio parahaemolyticus]MCX4135708.1 hypothetical protein [Vibrio parahaemolyticus]MCZ5867315.1 hypothetical protein [Vibrio parahaemolyticus]MCZ5897950.1 hypothetical protein [Vibrio parahaemolyticus]MCZ6020246.1 hypothetical protein [Vibrio parahaemolyticus]
MLFDIKENQQILIKAILNAVKSNQPRESACDVAFYVNPTMHQVTSVGMMFIVEQLKVLGAIKSIDGSLALTFEGGDLLHKLSAVTLTTV